MTFRPKVERWRDQVRLYVHGVPEENVLAMIQRESGGQPEVVSPTGYR